MNLKDLKKEIILSELKTFIGDERKLISKILDYLEQVEVRQIYLELGFSSMFAFCTGYLEYTPQEAQIRIQAMRLGRSVPEVKTKIESGSLSLSVAAKVQGHIAKENKINREAKMPRLPLSEIKELVQKVENMSVRNSEEVLFEHFPQHAEKTEERVKQVSSDTVRVEMNLTKETFEMLKSLQALRAHAHQNQEFENVIHDLCKLGLQRWNPAVSGTKKSEQSRPKTDCVDAPVLRAQIKSRHIPAVIKRKVWNRDGGECQYQDKESGRVCRDRFGLQLDHVKPFALGGEHSE